MLRTRESAAPRRFALINQRQHGVDIRVARDFQHLWPSACTMRWSRRFRTLSCRRSTARRSQSYGDGRQTERFALSMTLSEGIQAMMEGRQLPVYGPIKPSAIPVRIRDRAALGRTCDRIGGGRSPRLIYRGGPSSSTTRPNVAPISRKPIHFLGWGTLRRTPLDRTLKQTISAFSRATLAKNSRVATLLSPCCLPMATWQVWAEMTSVCSQSPNGANPPVAAYLAFSLASRAPVCSRKGSIISELVGNSRGP